MLGFKSWFSLVVVSPPTLALLLCLLAPLNRNMGGTTFALHDDGHEDQATDEMVALQKIGLKKTSGTERSAAKSRRAPPVKFIKNSEILKEFPKTPPGMPEHLEGIWWMDQEGAYGESTMPISADDLCYAHHGTNMKWNPNERITQQPPLTDTWQWYNSWWAYTIVFLIDIVDLTYENHFSEDYTFQQQLLTFTLPVVGGKYTVPPSIINFTSVAVPPAAPGECPPPENATPTERNKCAHMIRKSYLLQLIPFISDLIGDIIYPVYKVADKDNNPIQPYFDVYVAHANAKSKPDPLFASVLLGLGWGKLALMGGLKPNTSMLALNPFPTSIGPALEEEEASLGP